MRYYYKSKVGKGYLNLKTPLEEGIENYIEITEEEYEPIKTQRQAWRNEINELESN